MLSQSHWLFQHNKTHQPLGGKKSLKIWKFGQDLKINVVGERLTQFKFSLESQLVWVMNNGPWSFENHLLLLWRWEKGMTAFSINFSHIPLWVQV